MQADPDFPNDPDEMYYFVPGKKQFTSISESMSAEGRAEMDDAMARALMGTGGALSKDAVVRVAGFQNRDAEAAFLQQYESSVGNLPDHSPPVIESGDDPDGGGEPEPTKPMTSIDKARALLPKILAEGQTAGGFVISLHAHDMSDKLISQMQGPPILHELCLQALAEQSRKE